MGDDENALGNGNMVIKFDAATSFGIGSFDVLFIPCLSGGGASSYRIPSQKADDFFIARC